MCIEPGEEFNLGCAIIDDVAPTPVPPPVRTWLRDDVIIYSIIAGESIQTDQFVDNNPIFTPGLFDPNILTTTADGSIQYRTTFVNVTSQDVLMMAGFTMEEALNEVLNFALGTWTCTTSNNLGNATVRSVISLCGKLTTCSCFTA